LLEVGTTNQNRGSLVTPILVFGGLLALVGYARLVQVHKSRLLGELVTRAAGSRVLDVAEAIDLLRFEDSTFHDKVGRAQAAQYRFGQALSAFFQVTSGILGSIAVLFVLASVKWLLFPVAVFVAVPMAIASRFNANEEFRFMHAVIGLDRRRSYLESLLLDRGPAKEVRAHELAPFIRSLHDDVYDERMHRFRSLLAQNARRSLASAIVTSTTAGAFVAGLLSLYIAGKLSLATAGTAGYGVLALAGQLTGLARSINVTYESLLVVAELDDLLAEATASTKASKSFRPVSFAGIRTEDLVFSYPTASKPAVDRVSLEIDPGEVIALVGPNGSGKTTVAKLLAGLYVPDAGRILWGGRDMRDFDPADVRDRVAIGFQDFERFRMSLSENIGAGRHERRHRQDEVARAARRAGVSAFVDTLPQRFETVLGPEFDSGCDLSEGQWQRVAVARVFFRNADLVILDEPTASLDPLAEFELFETMREALDGRCAVVISHRLSSVRMADRIYVMRQGHVVESGSHLELLAEGDLYSELFNIQASAYMPRAAMR
jgi:ATP-binding cassette subfamily B protein